MEVEAVGEKKFYSYDISKINMDTDEGYDQVSFIVALQGLVNRSGPRLYLYKANYWPLGPSVRADVEQYWMEKFKRPGEWLADYEEIKLGNLDELINVFKGDIKGVVAWDSRVDSTVNVATTVAGVEGGVVVMHGGGLYRKLVENYKLPVLVDLFDKNFGDTSRVPETSLASFHSSKANAYLWLIEKYLKTGKVNRTVFGYLEDAYSRHDPAGDSAEQVTAKDWIVMKGALVFDLSPMNAVPNDDSNQRTGVDREVFEEIMKQARNLVPDGKMFEVLGFYAWYDKYNKLKSSANFTTAEVEEASVKLFSKYNAGLIPVDHVPATNLSFHFHAPRNQTWKQNNPVKSTIKLENKTYLLYYMGDYDPISWLSFVLPTYWEDSKRGSLPLAWSVGTYDGYYPDMINYLYKTKTKNDYFVAPFSGCLYVWPELLMNSSKYAERCKEEYQKRDYKFTGITKGEVGEYFSTFSGGGVGMEMPVIVGEKTIPSFLIDGTPFVRGVSLVYDRNPVGELVYKIKGEWRENGLAPEAGKRPNFIVLRLSPWTPSQVADFDKRLRESEPELNFEAVDAYTFFGLAKASLSGVTTGAEVVVGDNKVADLEDLLIWKREYLAGKATLEDLLTWKREYTQSR